MRIKTKAKIVALSIILLVGLSVYYFGITDKYTSVARLDTANFKQAINDNYQDLALHKYKAKRMLQSLGQEIYSIREQNAKLTLELNALKTLEMPVDSKQRKQEHLQKSRDGNLQRLADIQENIKYLERAFQIPLDRAMQEKGNDQTAKSALLVLLILILVVLVILI